MKLEILKLVYILKTRGRLRGKHSLVRVENNTWYICYSRHTSGDWKLDFSYPRSKAGMLYAVVSFMESESTKLHTTTVIHPVKFRTDINAIDMSLSPIEEFLFMGLDGDGQAIDAIKDILRV